MQWQQSGEHPHLVANIKHWGILTKVNGILLPKNINRAILIFWLVMGCGNHLNLKILVSNLFPGISRGGAPGTSRGGTPRILRPHYFPIYEI